MTATKLLTAGLVLGFGLGLTGCTGQPVEDRVDARAYYTDYRAGEAETRLAPSGARLPGAVANGGADAGAAPTAAATGSSMPPERDEQWPGIDDDNDFTDVGASGWTRADDNPKSTFGLDVDTGSYRVGRTFLEAGSLPPADSIRVEEWVNAFDYGDPAPPRGRPVGLRVEAGQAARGTTSIPDGTALVRVAIGTDRQPILQGPAHVTFVVDTSGSMDIRERLGLVKASLALLVNNLEADDTIAIVEYGSEARQVLAPTRVADSDRIVAAIDRLRPSGSTNMAAGLELGYRLAEESLEPGAVNAVVLASDGVANVGVTDAGTLTERITQAGARGIHLVTVGFGMGNYNDTLMEQLADRGDGFYSYVDSYEEAKRLFVDDLQPTLTVVASDAKAQVTFDPERVARYRLIGYENRALADEEFTDETVDAGELGAGHHVSALYEVQPAGDLAPGTPIGMAAVRWAAADDGRAQQADDAITWPDGPAPSGLRLAGLVAATAEVLRGDPVAEARGLNLPDLRSEAEALSAERVLGAEELADLLELAMAARPN